MKSMSGKKNDQKKMTTGRFTTLILAFVMFCVAGGVVMSSLFIPLVIGSSKVVDNALPQLATEDVRFDLSDLPQQSQMFAADGTLMATFYDQNRIVVALKDVSEYMTKAIVAREDSRFFEHSGVDITGVARAFVTTYIAGGDQQGGSSITQQYVKNILITTAQENNDPIGAYHAKEDTPSRKIREMLIALQMENKYSKAQILQGYLNIAAFGSNVYGVEAAAQTYFSKPAKDLTLSEAAMIAGITKNPTGYDPRNHPDKAQFYRDIVLDKMVENNYITEQQANEAKAQDVESMLHVQEVQTGCQIAGNAAYFCDYVVHQITNSEKFGKTENERRKLLKEGGLKIYTTLDVNAQNIAWQAVRDVIPEDDRSGFEAIIASVKPGTGEVISMAQNRTYDVSPDAGPTKTAINYAVDQKDGGGIGFAPGSTWKPINLAAWMKAGHSAGEFLPTYTVYAQNTFGPCYPNDSSPWKLQNAGGGTVSPETPMQALNQSHNTTQASMAQKIGLCAIADMAADMGYHNSSTAKSDIHSTITPSMVIGTTSVSPLTMANVYATIAAAGKACDPIAITKIIDRNDRELDIPTADCRQVMDDNVAQTLLYAMNQNVTVGLANEAQLANGRKTFAKTGTNEDTYLSTAGFTKEIATFAIVGNAERPVSFNGACIKGKCYSTWYGMYIASPLFKQFMNNYLDSNHIPNDTDYGSHPDQNLLKRSYASYSR